MVQKYLSNRSEKTFLIEAETGYEVSYEEHYEDACKLASWLQKNDFKTGDKIGIILDNSIFLAKFYFACLYCGVVVVPINPTWAKSQIQYVMSHADIKALLTTQDYYEALQSFFNEKLLVLLVNSKVNKPQVLSLCLEDLSEDPTFKLNFSLENVAVIIYTSGTTADPKGVVHTIHNLIQNGKLFVETLGIQSHHRFLGYLPMTYLGGYYNLLLIPYLAKASVVVSAPFSSAMILNFWSLIIKYQINAIWFVPAVISILMASDRDEEGKKYAREHIKLALIGTAPLRRELKKQFEARYGILLYENYGLSETLFISTASPLYVSEESSVGRVLPGIQVEILRDNAFDEPGEIVVKTPYLLKQYYGEVKKDYLNNQKYFLTGDVGKLASNQDLVLTDRKKDLIIRGGVNISPATIEAILHQHPLIEECAVIGVPDDFSGEEVVAVVKMKEGAILSSVQQALQALCDKNLSKLQQPKCYLSLSEFPCTPTGKIQKAKIKAWACEALKNPPLPDAKPVEVMPQFFKPSHVVSNIDQAVSIKYNNMVYEKQQAGENVVVLSLGEAFFDIPLFDFTMLPFPKLYHYSHSRGIIELRKKLSEYFSREYEVAFDPETEIVITAGSKVAIYMAMLAILNPDDEVLLYEPAWVSYSEQIKLCSAVPVHIPYWESVYDFEKYITNRTRLIIINNPNNPRGNVFSLDELVHLYRLAEKYNLFILSDEAYSDFVEGKDRFISLGNIDRQKKHSIICNSISKNFGISGWRIGYIISNPSLIHQMLKLNQHLITCPATILEYYVAMYFDEILRHTKPQISALNKKRAEIQAYMDGIGLSYLPGSSTFYFFVSISPTLLDSDTFCMRFLNEHNICVVPGIGYGISCDKFVRVSIGAEPLAVIKPALTKLKEFILQTSKNNDK